MGISNDDITTSSDSDDELIVHGDTDGTDGGDTGGGDTDGTDSGDTDGTDGGDTDGTDS